MRVFLEGDKHRVESREGGFYIVDMKKNICTCPHYRYRSKRQGSDCKHLQYLKARSNKADDCIGFVLSNAFVASEDLREAFGDKLVDELLSAGELVDESGKLRCA